MLAPIVVTATDIQRRMKYKNIREEELKNKSVRTGLNISTQQKSLAILTLPFFRSKKAFSDEHLYFGQKPKRVTLTCLQCLCNLF